MKTFIERPNPFGVLHVDPTTLCDTSMEPLEVEWPTHEGSKGESQKEVEVESIQDLFDQFCLELLQWGEWRPLFEELLTLSQEDCADIFSLQTKSYNELVLLTLFF